MKILQKQIIASVGLNKNNVSFSEECFRKCVENIKNNILPISDNFDRNQVIGTMTNFTYENGHIFADITLLDDPIFELDKICRCMFKCEEKQTDNNIINVTKADLLEGGWIDAEKDADRELL